MAAAVQSWSVTRLDRKVVSRIVTWQFIRDIDLQYFSGDHFTNMCSYIMQLLA